MKCLSVLLMVFAICIGPGVSPGSAAPLQPAAARFGPLVLEDLDGAPASLAGLRGKVVVLNFWATWCKPCVEEMPLLGDLAKRYRERGVVVVAVSVDEADSRSDIARMAAALPDALQVWVGATLDDMQRLELGASVPVTVLLDRDGSVAQRHLGALTPGSLDAQIEALIGKAREPKKLHGAVEAVHPHGADSGDAEMHCRVRPRGERIVARAQCAAQEAGRIL